MKQCKKALALVLALVMLMSAVAVGLTASADAKALYTGSGLKDEQMNSVDEYDLTFPQYASVILDFADKALGNANLGTMTFGLVGGLRLNIDLTSTTGLNNTLVNVKTLKESVDSLPLGDLADLDFKDISAANARNFTSSQTDVDFVDSLVKFLSNSNNYTRIAKVIKAGIGSGDGQFSLGLVNSFVKSYTESLNDIPGMLKEMVFGDKDANVDTEVATLISDLLNDLDVELLEGYTFESSDTIYSTIDKLVRVISNWALKQLHEDKWNIKDSILSALPDFEKEYPFVKLDNITEIDWDWSKVPTFKAGDSSTYLVYYLNDIIGSIVETVIPEFKDFTGSLKDISSTAGWKKDHSASKSLTTLSENLAKAAQFADIKLTGGTFTDAEAEALTNPIKTYAMVLADSLLKIFFPGIKVEKKDIEDGNIAVLAVVALNEFFAYYLPGNVLTDLYTYGETGTVINRTKYTETYCRTLYKQMGAQVIAKFVTGYFPITFTNTNNLDTVLKDMLSYFMNKAAKAGNLAYGALGTVSSSDTAYTAVDRIIFSLDTSGNYKEGASPTGERNVTGVLPEGLLPDVIKTSGHTHCTSKDLIDHLFNCVETLDFASLFKVLVPNSSSTEMTTPLFPNLVSYELIRILNVLFKGTWTSKTASLNSLITKDNLATILTKILANLNLNYHAFPGMKLIANLMGLSSPQTRGDANVSLAKPLPSGGYGDIEPIIPSTSTSIPDGYYVKVDNTSKGINGGYHNKSGGVIPFEPYKLRVQSIVCENNADVIVTVPNNNKVIASDSSNGYAISNASGKSIPQNSLLVFLVKYQLSDESGQEYGDVQESRLYTYFGAADNTTASSGEITASIPKVVYGSPSMFNSAVGYYKATKAETKYSASAEDTAFPEGLVNAGFNFKAATIGTPKSTTDTQFNPFSVNVPSSVKISDYQGEYTFTYKMKTMDTSADDPSYGSNTNFSVKWVLFDDGGLQKLVNDYKSRDLQSVDFDNTTLWNAFHSKLREAQAMLFNPASVSTSASALASAFAAEKEQLEAAFKALDESSTADYTGLIKERLIAYADGDPENDIRPQFSRWDYATVGYTRYDKTISTLRTYLRQGEKSSIKVNEALRYNAVVAETNMLFMDTVATQAQAAAKTNLTGVYNYYNEHIGDYTPDKYTPKSIEPLQEALEQAATVLEGTGIDGKTPSKTSDYADARNDILSSLNKLITQPFNKDKIASLNALVEEYKAQYNDNMYYTDEAWEVFEKALDDADKVINDPYEVLPKDYTDADIAQVNAEIDTVYIPNLNAAVEYLVAHPYISSLSGIAQGAVAYELGDKLIVGSKVIEAGDYLILPYGTARDQVQLFFEFSKNTSRYTKDDDGNWNTYCSVEGNVSAKVYNEKTGRELASSSTKVKTGNTVKVNTGDGELVFTAIVSCQLSSGSAASAPNFPKTKAQIAGVLPDIIYNIGVDAMKDTDILACDLNGDGMIDNTDLVLLKLWQNDKYTPYNLFG